MSLRNAVRIIRIPHHTVLAQTRNSLYNSVNTVAEMPVHINVCRIVRFEREHKPVRIGIFGHGT